MDVSRPVDLSLISRKLETELPTDPVPQPVLEYLHFSTGLPPAMIDIQGESWDLLSALELDTTEMEVSSPSDLGLGLGQPDVVRVRTVRSTDLSFGDGRSTHYAEVSTPTLLTSHLSFLDSVPLVRVLSRNLDETPLVWSAADVSARV